MFDTDKGRELYRLEDKKSSLTGCLLDKTGLFGDLARTESKTENALPETVLANYPIFHHSLCSRWRTVRDQPATPQHLAHLHHNQNSDITLPKFRQKIHSGDHEPEFNFCSDCPANCLLHHLISKNLRHHTVSI
ncbi:MAG: hypothetical protein ACI89U_002153 [Gammaproteobacteria bacterium]|jgi:hypothetical protein